jgi:hypothetical protein
MSVDLDDLMEETEQTEATFGEKKLLLTYRPNCWTPQLEQEAKKSQSSQEAGPMLITMLGAVLAGWDLVRHGVPVGTDAESLAGVPMKILTVCLQAIGEALNPQPASVTNSEGSF